MASRSRGRARNIRSASPCEMMWWPVLPSPTEARSSTMSLRRTLERLRRYSLAPSVCTSREMETSLNESGKLLPLLSKVSVTDARLIRGAEPEPLKIRSSPRLPRSILSDCSPKTQRKASAMLLFPEPLGPTIAVMGASKVSSVFFANDLKPESSIFFNRTELL